MTDDDTPDRTEDGPADAGGRTRRRVGPRLRRRWKIALGALVGIGALALLIFVAPTQAARWLLASELEALGLEASGVETVEIDLWTREIWFGPLAIGPPGEDPARVERFGLTVSLGALFDRRGLGERATIEGVVLDLRRAEDGRLLLNGVDLVALAAGGPDDAAPSDPPAQSESTEPGAGSGSGSGSGSAGSGWGAGLGDFTLADSRVRFTDRTGGEAVLEIDRLALEDFRTWAPQTPGAFSLDATLNDMGVAVEGTATPFADRIEIAARTELSAVAIDKVTRYTGSLGLSRGEGEMYAALDHRVAIESDGAVTLETEGEATLDGLAIGLPDGPEIAFERVTVAIDTDKRFAPAGAVAVAGGLSVEGAAADLILAAERRVRLEQARLALSDMDLAVDAAGAVTGGVALALESEGGSLELDDRRLTLASGALDSTLTDARIAPDGGLDLGLTLELTLNTIGASGPQAGDAEAVTLSLAEGRIERAAQSNAFSAAGDLTLTLDAPTWSLDGLEGALAGLDLTLADARVARADGATTLEAALAAALDAPRLDLAAAGDAPALAARADRLDLDLDALSLTLADGGAPGWSIAGGAEVAALALDLDPGAGAGAPAARSAQAARLALQELALQDDLTGRLGDLTLEGLTLANRRGAAGRATLDRLQLREATRRAEGDGFLTALEGLTLGALTLTLRGDPPVEAGLDAARLDAIALREPGEGPQRLTVETAAVEGARGAVAGGEALEAGFDRLDLSALDLSAAPRVALGEGTLAGFTASLDLGRLAGPGAAASEDAAPEDTAAGKSGSDAGSDAGSDSGSEEVALAAPAPIRIGAFSLADSARIAIEDTRLNPPVSLQAVVERLRLADFDSESREAEPAIDLSATLNEFTTLALSGWAQPFGAAPRFQLDAEIDQLQLPTFSPYAAKHLGVNLETGRMTASAEGGTEESMMAVQTQLRIENLGFSSLSDEDRERLSEAAGMPVETAVGMLEDRDGVIALEIPIRGDLTNPQFELDQVIGKAVANAVVGTITTTLQVLFPPALLISAVDAASAAATGVDFAPAPFEPGGTNLTEQATTLLSSLGDLLKSRPKLTVTVCGRATAADRRAALAGDVQAAIAQRETRYETALAGWRRAAAAFIEDGVVSETGALLVETRPDDLPAPPERPALDPAAVEAELAAERADELRARLTDLASQRTRVARRDLAERQQVETEQVAECRPIYDPDDEGPPRVSVEL